jgi:hypothetical protein
MIGTDRMSPVVHRIWTAPAERSGDGALGWRGPDGQY